jgi:hypothetical protein
VSWGGPAAAGVTRVVLAAPSSVTHGFDTNQRIIILRIVSRDDAARTLTVRAPPNTNVAVPQQYMLFLINRKTYSTAQWIRLDTQAALAGR